MPPLSRRCYSPMAGLIIVGAVWLQPKMASFLDKLKARHGESTGGGDAAIGNSNAGGLIRKRTTLRGLLKSKSTPVIDSADVSCTWLLLLMARQLRDQFKAGSAVSYDQPPPEELADDALPSYSRRDPNQGNICDAAPRDACQDPELLWRAMLSQSVSRLELFCIEVLPIAAKYTGHADPSSGGSSSNVKRAAQRLPESLLPPPDVCLAWMATITGPGWSQLAMSNHPLAALAQWEFPLAEIATCYSQRGGVPNLRGSEKMETFWTQTSGTPFDVARQFSGPSDSDILSRGVRVHCPSPSCGFSAAVPYLGPPSGSGDSGGEGGTGGGQDGSQAPRRSKRGVAERQWRRKCQDCGQSTDMDTLVGRKFVEDVTAWCNASGRFGAAHFEGLLVDPDTGEQDSTAADVWATQIFSPLFSPALSEERNRRIDALKAEGTLGNGTSPAGFGAVNSNSLGAAMRNAAMSTFATTPYALGDSCGWSFHAIAEWVAEHTLAVHPMPALAGDLKAGMPNEHHFPDQMGGGFSASGLDFTAENPYESESAKPAAVQAREKRQRLLAIVNRVLDPYRRLRADGVPSVEHTVDGLDDSQAQRRWTNIVLGIERPVKAMLDLTSDIEQWATSAQAAESGQQNGAGATPASLLQLDGKMPEAVCALYIETILQLKSSRSRSRTTLKREPLSLRVCKQLLGGGDTPAEVRMGRLTHELKGSSGSSKANGGSSYEDVFATQIGAVPRGLVDGAR